MDECKAELRARVQPFDEKMEVGAMIEIPSVAATTDLLAKTCDFSESERTTSSNTCSRLTAATTGYVNQLGVVAAIPPESQSFSQTCFDEHLYRESHRIENLSAKLKSFRRIATRYDKLLRSSTAFVSLAYIIVWLRY